MKVELDNIIFSLQKSGGASVVWQQHLQRLLKDIDFKCSVIEFDNALLNLFRNELNIDNQIITKISSTFLPIKRYLNLHSNSKEKHLFHSSHYRIKKAINAINVTTVHDFTYEYYVKGLKQKVHSWQKNNAINDSNGVICISNSTKKDLLHFLPNFDQRKIRVIYNGVDEVFKVVATDNSFQLPFEEYSYALYVGDRKSIHKNFNFVVDVCSISKIPLLMIGGGILNEYEIKLLNLKLGESNYKCITGVSSIDLNYYYNKAKCLLYLSLYEGFGIPVVEAQRAGCPVLAINGSSIPEVLGNMYLALNESNAKLFADKINELSSNIALRNESIEIGFEKSKKFSWQNTYAQTKEFYKELYEK
jgi:glycosyltransferase involved in cell wall biosynthesis